MKSDGKRLDEAKEILAALGMPKPQQNPNAIYTFVAFANVGPRTSWAEASAPRLTPHDVIAFANTEYGKAYAENTRETIRRQAIHQFVQGGILMRNPDEPGLATNSPRTHYALTSEVLDTIRAFGTPGFVAAAAKFLTDAGGGLAVRYAKARTSANVIVNLDGEEIALSPGAHNRLHQQIIEQFRPTFAPGARVLYLGDTDHKSKRVDDERLAAIGVPVTKHDKLPDVVLHDERRGWLFLIEAVTTHGPVSAKRHMELESALAASAVGRVYVSAFPSFREFKKYAHEIAWETEVWIADAPDHMLHFNGDRFFGPRT
ncbi:MAG: restriction endonuclease [Myxococcota bacterium]|nr:restriction endonuclease [Myxococcota bacterium]